MLQKHLHSFSIKLKLLLFYLNMFIVILGIMLLDKPFLRSVVIFLFHCNINTHIIYSLWIYN